MTKEDLIQIQTRPIEEQRMLQSRGGSARTPAKKRAAQLRELKKRGLTDDTSLQLLKLIEDPQFASLDILEYIRQLKTANLTPKQATDLGHLMIAWHKMNFGDKKIQTLLNIKLSAKCVTVRDVQMLMREGMDLDDKEETARQFDEDDIVDAEIVEEEGKEDKSGETQ